MRENCCLSLRVMAEAEIKKLSDLCDSKLSPCDPYCKLGGYGLMLTPILAKNLALDLYNCLPLKVMMTDECIGCGLFLEPS